MKNGDRIAVIGASPIGCILAASLLDIGKDVTIIEGDADLLAAIRANGLSIEGTMQIEAKPDRLYASAGAAAEAKERFDVVFVCVKTDTIRDAVGALPLLIDHEGTAVRLQNGLDTEAPVLEILGPQRCLRGVINYSGNSREPGRVIMTFFDPPNYVGAAVPGEAAAEARARRIVDLMNEARLDCRLSGDVRVQVWETVIRHSAMLPISALTGMDVAQVMGSPHSLQLLKGLLTEAIAVAAKVGFHFDQKFYYDTLTYYVKAGHHMPSMWSDVRLGRRTEVEVLNHKIAEYGELHGVEVPYQRAVANLLLCIDELAALEKRSGR
jgi:2-dehydropantoate 2-reductase